MSASWFVIPETVRIDLSDGQWIEVKKQLTIGEERKVYASLVKEVRGDGRITPDLEMVGKAEVLAYLVDWSLRDGAGKAVRIDTDARKTAAIDQLHPVHFKAISEAVTAHIAVVLSAAETEKKMTADAGSIASEVT